MWRPLVSAFKTIPQDAMFMATAHTGGKPDSPYSPDEFHMTAGLCNKTSRLLQNVYGKLSSSISADVSRA